MEGDLLVFLVRNGKETVVHAAVGKETAGGYSAVGKDSAEVAAVVA